MITMYISSQPNPLHQPGIGLTQSKDAQYTCWFIFNTIDSYCEYNLTLKLLKLTACTTAWLDLITSSVTHNDTSGFVQYTQGDRTPAGSSQCIQMILVCHCGFSMRAALCRWAAAISKYTVSSIFQIYWHTELMSCCISYYTYTPIFPVSQ